MAKLKGRAKEFADLDARDPKAFDPEDDVPVEGSEGSDSEEGDDGLAGTEHYGEVSKLRQPDVGPGYAGSRVSREELFNDDNSSSDPEDEGDEEEDEDDEEFANPDDADINADDGGEDEDIDSDAAFGESDAEKFSKFTFRGSSHRTANGVKKRPTASDFMSDSDNQEDVAGSESSAEDETDEDILDVDEQHSDEEEDSEVLEDEDDASESDEEEDRGGKHGSNKEAKRAELRKIMNEEQSTVIAAISQAAKDDANKGNAVRQQRKVFDSLLNVRIALQKGLIATNSLSTVEESAAEEDSGDKQPYQAAEDAALKLWNTLDGIRHELTQTSGASKKRKRDVDSSTSSASIWERMQDLEVASLDSRRRVLEKWWGKVKGSAPTTTGKLIGAAPAQTITSSLQEQLAKPGAVEGTRRPRSCAPVQEKQKLVEDAEIYDDTGFYKLLLNQLVEQRRAEAGPTSGGVVVPAQWAVKEAKMRKVVDTKASKGRKLRYTVHEKLQNFMAPEDRTQWTPEAIDRFFGTLLGQKMTLGEDAMEVDGEEEEEITPEEAGLRLFRS